MPEENKNMSVPVAIVIAALIVAAAIFFTRNSSTAPKGTANNNQPQQQGEQPQANNEKPAPITDADHVLGDPNAPITFLVYSDLQCPYCRRFHEDTIKQMMDEYGKLGKVRLVYRHFPLPASLHPNALNFALASECVTDLGGKAKFWEFIDKLFSTNGQTLDDALAIAQSLGVDKVKVKSCVDSQKFLQKIQDNQSDGARIGVAGTPYSVIMTKDGKVTPIDRGAIPYTELKPLLERTLGNQ